MSITEFLLDLFREGKEYSTVNSYRSAISVSHPDIDGMAIGKHPVITRFMQGIYNSRPSQPRYKFVWDVRIVVRHIKAMLPSEKLPLKELIVMETGYPTCYYQCRQSVGPEVAGFEFQGFHFRCSF